MARLSVAEILDAISALPKEEQARFEGEYERIAWEECLSDPEVVAAIKDRHAEVQEALKQNDAKTLERLRAEFEAQGLL